MDIEPTMILATVINLVNEIEEDQKRDRLNLSAIKVYIKDLEESLRK